jgi:hypothetical protein
METKQHKAIKKRVLLFLTALMIIFSLNYCESNLSDHPLSDNDHSPSSDGTANRQIDQAPQLISPVNGALMDNGRIDQQDLIIWDFYWSSVPNADFYEIRVIHHGSQYPAINCLVWATSYFSKETAYIADRNRFNWEWKVRGCRQDSSGDRMNGPWSEERTFDAEPVDTDPPSQ